MFFTENQTQDRMPNTARSKRQFIISKNRWHFAVKIIISQTGASQNHSEDDETYLVLVTRWYCIRAQ